MAKDRFLNLPKAQFDGSTEKSQRIVLSQHFFTIVFDRKKICWKMYQVPGALRSSSFMHMSRPTQTKIESTEMSHTWLHFSLKYFIYNSVLVSNYF